MKFILICTCYYTSVHLFLDAYVKPFQGDDDLKDTGFHLTTSKQGASAVGPGFSLKF